MRLLAERIFNTVCLFAACTVGANGVPDEFKPIGGPGQGFGLEGIELLEKKKGLLHCLIACSNLSSMAL